MKKYIVIYFASSESDAKMETMSPEDQAKMIEPWMAWNSKFEKNISDLGAPLSNGEAVGSNEKWQLSNQNIGGYSIVQGKSIVEVKSIFKNHPHLSWSDDASIGVFEMMVMG